MTASLLLHRRAMAPHPGVFPLTFQWNGTSPRAFVLPPSTPIGALILFGVATNISGSSTQIKDPSNANLTILRTDENAAGGSFSIHQDIYTRVCQSGDPGGTFNVFFFAGAFISVTIATYAGITAVNANAGTTQVGGTSMTSTTVTTTLSNCRIVKFFSDDFQAANQVCSVTGPPSVDVYATGLAGNTFGGTALSVSSRLQASAGVSIAESATAPQASNWACSVVAVH